jgi:hypothetical protein
MWVRYFPCSCGQRIALPRQILQETYESPRGLVLDGGPLAFLCGFCGIRTVGLPPSPNREYVPEIARHRDQCLWKVECECATGNCREHAKLYVFYLESETPSEIAWRAYNEVRTLTCADGHECLINPDAALVEKLL